MRFLTTFVSLLVFFLVLAGVGFYFTREYFLYRGVENFKKQVLVLKKTNAAVCNSKSPDLLGVVNPDGQPKFQIRFTSDTEYLLEVICPGYELQPVVVGQGMLDTYVSKVPGSSGIIIGEARTGVELVAFKNIQDTINKWFSTNLTFIEKSNRVVLENSDFIVTQPHDDLGAGPITSCQGYGYQCCQAETQIGVGNKIDGLQGCETTCYSACASRPFVLSFTSNPFFDVKDRTVQIANGESIDFSYVIDQGASSSIQALLDYGDGSSDQSLEKNATLSHSYKCTSGTCQYNAIIKVTDSAGVESAQTPASVIHVTVTQ